LAQVCIVLVDFTISPPFSLKKKNTFALGTQNTLTQRFLDKNVPIETHQNCTF